MLTKDELKEKKVIALTNSISDAEERFKKITADLKDLMPKYNIVLSMVRNKATLEQAYKIALADLTKTNQLLANANENMNHQRQVLEQAKVDFKNKVEAKEIELAEIQAELERGQKELRDKDQLQREAFVTISNEKTRVAAREDQVEAEKRNINDLAKRLQRETESLDQRIADNKKAFELEKKELEDNKEALRIEAKDIEKQIEKLKEEKASMEAERAGTDNASMDFKAKMAALVEKDEAVKKESMRVLAETRKNESLIAQLDEKLAIFSKSKVDFNKEKEDVKKREEIVKKKEIELGIKNA